MKKKFQTNRSPGNSSTPKEYHHVTVTTALDFLLGQVDDQQCLSQFKLVNFVFNLN